MNAFTIATRHRVGLSVCAILALYGCKPAETQRYQSSGSGASSGYSRSGGDAVATTTPLSPLPTSSSNSLPNNTPGDGSKITATPTPTSAANNNSGDTITTGSGTTGTPTQSSSGSAASSAEDLAIERATYATYEFAGKGSITAENKSYATEATLRAELSATLLNADLKFMKILTPASEQPAADAKAAEMLGPRLSVRATASDFATLATQGFRKVPYVIFADVITKGLKAATFSLPVPIFPWTGTRASYNELDSGPQTWPTKINDQIDATVTVAKVSETGSIYVLKITLDIPADQYGELYKLVPMPKETVFEVDMATRNVTRMTQLEWFKNDSQNRRDWLSMVYTACRVTRGAIIQTYPCL